jgi:hypothetical protein
LLLPAAAAAQTVEVREVSVKKDRPDEIFYRAATRVVLWIRDDVGQFESLVGGRAELRRFEDDRGTDLIAAHREQTRSWKEKVDRLREEGRFVSFGRSRELLSAEEMDDEGAGGFYLTVESWGLPAEEARSLRLSASVPYITALEERRTKSFEDFVFANTKIIEVEGYGLRPTDFSTSEGTRQFKLYTNLPVRELRIHSPEGTRVGGIAYTFNGRPVVEMDAAYFDKAVKLVVTYQVPQRMEARFDLKIGLGTGLLPADAGQ